MVLYTLIWGFGKGNDFWESGAKIVSHFGAKICSPGRRIIKLFKAKK